MKKIKQCYFIHYSTIDTVPYHVQVYINELSRHFDKVTVITNNTTIQNKEYLLKDNVEINHKKNRGYDFGMFYQYIVNVNLNDFSQIAIINDSNILLNKLDTVFNWAKNNESDFWGIIDSHEKPWFSSHDSNYHIQSHFLVFNRLAIDKLAEYLRLLDINEIMNENNTKQLRRLVIDKWEIGVSQYLISQNLKFASFIENKSIRTKYNSNGLNLTHKMYHELAREGYPLLKKKVITENRKWYKPNRLKWKDTISQYGYKNWDKSRIINECA